MFLLKSGGPWGHTMGGARPVTGEEGKVGRAALSWPASSSSLFEIVRESRWRQAL